MMDDGFNRQLVRYLIVGACGYILAVGAYAALLAVDVGPYPAVVTVFILNGAFNFLFFRRWAFPPTGRRAGSELLRFSAVAVVSLVLNYASFALLFSVLGIAALPAQAMAIIIATPAGFLANRYWSFRSRIAPVV